jgi:prepilin-type processing-associated H-X9-DG protein
LVELLTVVAIVGILAAILFSTLAAAKSRARLIQCKNNLRQQGIGLTGFVNDHGVYPLDFPPGADAFPNAIGQELNSKTISHDGGDPGWVGVFRCPSAEHWSVAMPGGGTQHNIDYGYNADGLIWIGPQGATTLDSLGLGGHLVTFCDQNKTHSSAPAVKSSEVNDPSDMLAIGDSFSGRQELVLDATDLLSRNRDWNGWPGQQSLDYQQIGKCVRARHHSTANLFFCDGHVNTLTFKSLFEASDDRALALWNRDHQPHREELRP